MAIDIFFSTTIEDPDLVMQTYNQIKIYRAPSKYGTYAELTDAFSRAPLQPGVTMYTYHDVAGELSYWYKSSFYHSSTFTESLPSDPRNFGTWGILADALTRRLMSEGNNLTTGQLYDAIFDASCELIPIPADITTLYDVELSWIVRRSTRHALATLINDYIAKPNVSKGSVSVSLGSSAQQLMSRVKQLDEEWYAAKQNKEILIWNGHIQQVQDSDKHYTEMIEGGYRIDPYSGYDHTQYQTTIDAVFDRVFRWG
jgi:hypothetical protein